MKIYFAGHLFSEGEKGMIYGLHTDVRSAFIGAKLNPMLRFCCDEIFATEDELIEVVKDKAR